MEPGEIAEHIKSLEDLDKVVILDRLGDAVVRIGWNVGLFFEKGETLEKRLQANDVLRDFLATFGTAITHYHPANASKLREIGDLDLVKYYGDDARATTQKSGKNDNDSYAADIYGFAGGKEVMEPAPYYFGIVATSREFPRASSIRANIPLAWLPEENHAAFISLFLRWCKILEPAHGTASPGPVFTQGGSPGSSFAQAYPLLQRFPGLDYVNPSIFSIETKSVYGEGLDNTDLRLIRTIGWLTALDDKFVSLLGGIPKIKSSIDSEVEIHSYKGGTVLQAGARPQLGDRNRGIFPSAYRSVANLMKPLVFRKYKMGFWNGIPKNFDRTEETKKWLERFD